MKASIYQRASDKKWVGALSLGKDEVTGKRNRITRYADTEKDIERIMNEIIYEIEHGEYIQDRKETLIGFLKEYHKIYAGYDMWNPNAKRPKKAKWEQTTSELYKMYIDVHFEPYFKNMKLLDIKTMTLDKFYNYKLCTPRIIERKKKGTVIKKEVSPMGINTVIKLNKFLKAAFHYAKDNDLIKKNPTDGVKLGSKEEFRPTIYNEEQFIQLLNYVQGTDDEIPIVLGGGVGLRRAEIFGLYWKNADFENKTLSIETTSVRFNSNIEKDPKNNTSKRTITVPDFVIAVLSDYKKAKNNPSNNEKIITRWKAPSYSERFKKLLDRFNMPHIRLHDLRHYNATLMMNYNVPDKVAAERLGHSNVQTLRTVYQSVLKEMDKKASDRINESMMNHQKQ